MEGNGGDKEGGGWKGTAVVKRVGGGTAVIKRVGGGRERR